MTKPILLQFLDKNYSNYHDYCVICMRTGKERRLEKSKYLQKFLQSINRNVFNEPHHRVCYICERQAAAAYRFLMATNLATYAHCAVQWLQTTPAITENFKTILNTHDFQSSKVDDNMDINLFKVSTLCAAIDCETRLRFHRMRSEFLTTEVLLVSTPSTVNIGTDQGFSLLHKQLTCFPRPGESQDQYVVPDDAPREKDSDTLELLTQPDLNMESIIILDDNPVQTKPAPIHSKKENGKRKLDNSPSLVPIEKLYDKLPKKTKPDDAPLFSGPVSVPSHQVILHPIVFNSGLLTVPSLSANIVEGHLIYRGLSETPKIALQNGTNMDFVSDPIKVVNILKKLTHHDADTVHIFTASGPNFVNYTDQFNTQSVITTEGKVSYPSQDNTSTTVFATGPCYVNNYPVQSNNATVFTTIPEVNYPTQINTTNNVNVNNKVNINDVLNKMVVSDMSSLSQDTLSRRKRKEKVAPAPSLRTDRIDWEDKIPMDVISFVDPDENFSKNVQPKGNMPALGIICSVTSLSETPPDDIIDLC